jgi:DNA-binding XRE family transcriptional regulator
MEYSHYHRNLLGAVMSNIKGNLLIIQSSKELGKEIRRKRKKAGIRIDDAAMMIGIAKETMSKIENGADGVAIGKVLLAAQELGVRLMVEDES